MSYFEDFYDRVRYTIGIDRQPGLRNAQLGAIHAIGAQITQHKGPMIVVLPTGSGKTGVLMMAAYLARAQRVLVLTPSRLVRQQIAEDFAVLKTLKVARVVDEDTPTPRVCEVQNRISRDQPWDSLREFDVIVGTPNSLSPEYEGIPEPPPDLFDLILIDEAHHVPASTWSRVLSSFEQATQILFTATPYRRDDKEIQGRIIYAYSVREAYEDGIFSDIQFEAVYPQGQASDIAIALAAQAALLRDRAAGLDHLIMVRTDRKTRAAELQAIYSENTDLKLRTVNSNQSLRHVQRVLRALRNRELDGVVCVDMLGEGFDLPNLKIAAVHSPHRSLEVTLQFIGRFARTGRDNIGGARFLAVPSEIQAETDRLYKEGAVWGEMVQNLTQGRVERERRIRETFERFESPDVSVDQTFDLSLASLRPYFHVKIYRTAAEIDVAAQLAHVADRETVFHTYSHADGTAIFIAQQIEQPRWSSREEFARVEYDLFVVVWVESAKLLFINSSLRSTMLYEAIAKAYTGGRHEILSLSRINRVLSNISDTEFFNIGMKNAIPNSPTESYRIIAGPRADEAIQKTDGRMFHRGHVFGKGVADGESITIGYSSASKVWTNKNAQIPELVAWCNILAAKIVSTNPVSVTRSGLDNLSVGEEIGSIPREPIIAMDWHDAAYRNAVSIHYPSPTGERIEQLLVNCELLVDRAGVTERQIPFTVFGDRLRVNGRYILENGLFRFEIDDANQELSVLRRDEELSLDDWLRNYPVDFYLADFSRLRGRELFRIQVGVPAFQRDRIIAFDWTGVDIQTEAGRPDSIHEFVRETLRHRGEGVVVYDHRSGEIADFVQLREIENQGEVVFYHIKASGGAAAGDRVDDVYEICGQVVRSNRWLYDLQRLGDQLNRRIATGSPIILGDRDSLNALMQSLLTRQVTYRIVAVQPGVSQGAMSDRTAHVLAAADDYLVRTNVQPLTVWGSR